MTGREVLETAEGRIREHRTADAQLRFVGKDGAPVRGFRGRIRLVRHEFLLGCNAFCIEGIEDRSLQRGYAERYAALLIYATLPFYWGFYEPQVGREDRRERLADWCRRGGIVTKGALNNNMDNLPSGQQRIVPFTVERHRSQSKSIQLCVGDLDSRVVPFGVQGGPNDQAGSGRGAGDQVHDRLVADQRPTSSISPRYATSCWRGPLAVRTDFTNAQ